jgi:glycine/D-amino acid oxidase-like deaminating enzyme
VNQIRRAAPSGGFENSLWSATLGPAAAFPTLSETRDASVAIIGGGFAGVSLALALAERGVSATVLEARRIGWGASGRNGGFVVPTLSRLDPDRMVETMGETGERLAQTVGSSADTVFALIRAHGIACDAAQSGWYQPAHAPEAWPLLQARYKQWAARGADVALLDPAETRRRTGCSHVHGSLFFAGGGTIHPLMLAHGLARAAARLGAAIFENSAVLRIDRTGDRWRLATAQGAVDADWVVVATNARTPDLPPSLGRPVAPMRIFQAATRPIPEDQRRHLFSKGEALSDTAINLFTYRFDRQWRLITGQIPFYPGQSRAALADLMGRRLRAMLNLPRQPEIAFIWEGIASVTPDFAPKLISLGPRMVATTACNGRGIAITIALGGRLAAAIAGDDWSEMPLPLSSPEPGRRHLTLRAGLRAFPVMGLLRDGRAFIPRAPAGVNQTSREAAK